MREGESVGRESGRVDGRDLPVLSLVWRWGCISRMGSLVVSSREEDAQVEVGVRLSCAR